MKYLYLTKAIHKLKPNAIFTFDEPVYSKIDWISLDGDAPTEKEIDDAIKAIKIDESNEADAKAAAKAAAQAKLEALGLTFEDLQALGL